MLLAAHLVTVTKVGAVAGPVTAESTSKISRQYAVIMNNGNFTGSKYGDEYALIVRNAPGCRLPRVF